MPKAMPKALRQFPPLGPEQRRIAVPAVIPPIHPYVIYFLRLGNRVKIGITKSLGARVLEFGLTRHQVVLLFDGDYQLEGSMHAHFAALRVDDTEWFRLGPQLFAFIKHWNAQPAVGPLGGGEYQARWEDLEQIAARTGVPVSTLRSWSRNPTWPQRSGVGRGQKRLYYRSQVDGWLARQAAA
jgi:hypothetical protein